MDRNPREKDIARNHSSIAMNDMKTFPWINGSFAIKASTSSKAAKEIPAHSYKDSSPP
jgi:hypothetical protein